MSSREASTDSTAGAHTAAAEAFATRATEQFDEELSELFVFGSTVRGEARGLASDVDVLVVLSETADSTTVGDALREIAYDVMLEHGPVVELHILSESAFRQSRRQNNPFVRTVVDEGQSYA